MGDRLSHDARQMLGRTMVPRRIGEPDRCRKPATRCEWLASVVLRVAQMTPPPGSPLETGLRLFAARRRCAAPVHCTPLHLKGRDDDHRGDRR
jgi:hypothetical protein